MRQGLVFFNVMGRSSLFRSFGWVQSSERRILMNGKVFTKFSIYLFTLTKENRYPSLCEDDSISQPMHGSHLNQQRFPASAQTKI
jgi:hypothetical protein